MSGKLQKEIHKNSPIDCVRKEAYLNVIRTADYLARGFEVLLKPYGLSPGQYNVMRIIRGVSESAEASPQGVPCKIIGEHMITRDPDISRLLNRLEARGMIGRRRGTKDRRVIFAYLTEAGIQALAQLDMPVKELHIKQLAHMPDGHITQVIDLLEQMRNI